MIPGVCLSVSLSVTRAETAETAKRIDVLFGVGTKNIVLDEPLLNHFGHLLLLINNSRDS